MKDQSQSGGDGASLSQAGRDIVDNSSTSIVIFEDRGSVDRLEAYKIAEELYEKRLPALTASARAQFEERAEDLTRDVIERVLSVDPEMLDRLREVRVQIALGTAQRGYAETGDDDLKKILSELVVGAIREKARTHRDLILRQSIDIAAKLTTQQLNALAALVQLSNTHFPDCIGARNLLRSVRASYSHYIDALPTSTGEYSYLASIGCGTEAQLTPELFGGVTDTPLNILYKNHRYLLHNSFYSDELSNNVSIGEIGHLVRPIIFTQSISAEMTVPHLRYRATKEFAVRAFENDGKEVTAPSADANFARYLREHTLSEEGFITLAKDEFPEIASMFDQIASTRGIYFQLNAVGRILGCQTAISHAPHKRAVFESILLDESEQYRH
ncbi:hypothetical protein I1A62_37040 [Rhodococcus sp. USK10]|uniref:LPO_1073/Vpar_1526 family protein n=1 Tax=Rhodococcus sp. USK10 TaxID=2789739 RepID=UPI001C5F0CFF|nr:LPO_1073/Vpar_1526 family protein [Rhodococcus sp. USK10]QYB02741.1 hypothetical protein I1A62_37040 [Rhodococcus sp. USK10]